VRVLVEEVSRQLIPLIGPFAEEVSVEWDRGEGREHPVITLRISDSSRAVSAVFEREELARPSHMQRRLARVWGNFLQLRADEHLAQFLTGRTEGGDG
jgi:hypothetical protein